MSPERYVLDTSAVLTLIEDEDGAERVEQILLQERAILPWIVLLEAHYIIARAKGESVADLRYSMLKKSTAEIQWDIDEPTLLTASRLKKGGKLSLADSVIAAIAQRHNAILVHKDPELEPLGDRVRLLPLPSKRTKKSRT